MYRILIALTLGLISSLAAAEQMYRWVDDNGVQQFGQQPPDGRAYQRINITSSPPPGGSLRQPEQTAVETPAEEPPVVAEQELTEEQQRQRTEQCNKVRANLRAMQTNPRLSRVNEDGEMVRLGEEERQQLIEEAQRDLDTLCND
ncbi:MAG: DUF4124 domain-containing protein [Gammaproteobacteria bacterium HGW-Gammaproteobacteria-6]|nr:MAG: DUF4124 domain-containing protein [Gammaproteobacteria bacterium HGW-Gammaproteobacteria-6]